MTNLRQAAQRALKAMEDGEWRADMVEFSDALIALRAALAEPEQPYDQTALDLCKVCGWRTLIPGDACLNCERSKQPEQEPVRLQCTTCGTVYADGVPPQVPEQEPQTTHWEGCEAVHPECRKQEPVAWRFEARQIDTAWIAGVSFKPPGIEGAYLRNITPLYTAPIPRKPLTEPELHAINPTWPAPGQEWGYEEVLAFVRAIERAHGIGEQA